MECKIYKGKRKQDYYLFIPNDSSLEQVPSEIRQMFGELELVMSLDLSPTSTLAQSDPEKVINMINEKGFYIQIPPLSTDEIDNLELY